MFDTCNKWMKRQDIKTLSSGGCLPLPRGYIHVHVHNHEENCTKPDLKEIFWNLQQLTEMTRRSCWHQKFVHKGLSVPVPGLYTCIKSWKMYIKSDFKEICFYTCSKWPKWQEVSMDIKILSPGVVCPWPVAIYIYEIMKRCV